MTLPYNEPHNNNDEELQAIIDKMTLDEKCLLKAGLNTFQTVPFEEHGIPSITVTDGPMGVHTLEKERAPFRQTGPATAFPCAIAMAATWNPELVRKAANVMAEETRAMGCEVLLAPSVNIVRTPLAGRNFECFSEDPYLTGTIGTAYVQGLQELGIGASLKHYACNNQEYERFSINSHVDERALREIYLFAFETIIKEANPWTIMAAYNRINGTYATEHKNLLIDILREEWGYDGIVISDWGATHTVAQAANGGLDLEMPGPGAHFGKELAWAVRLWQVEEDTVNESVKRILRLIFKTEKHKPTVSSLPSPINTPEHIQVAREVAEESITLLKNDHQTLPLQPTTVKKVAVIGPNAAIGCLRGGGSSRVYPPYWTNPFECLQNSLGTEIEFVYEKGCDNVIVPSVLCDHIAPSYPENTSGFLSEYFNNSELEGTPAITEIADSIDKRFLNPLFKGLESNRFSIRYTAIFTAPETGRYWFRVGTNEHARFFIDDTLTIEVNAQKKPPKLFYFEEKFLTFEEGTHYAFRFEYLHAKNEGVGNMELGGLFWPLPEDDPRMKRAVALAESADAALVFIGYPSEYESEGEDRTDILLPGRQNELVEKISQSNPNTIVIVNSGSPVAMPWVDNTPAIVHTYYPGMEGGNAITNILFGTVTPSGKLTMTFPRQNEDSPAWPCCPNEREIIYGESIFVGYRYFEKKKIVPLFPFGYGLSYTTFSYSDLSCPKKVQKNESVTIGIKVKNTGNYAGKEIVQIYISDSECSLIRPYKELKGFKKVSLKPNEEKVIQIELTPRDFSFYDTSKKSWRLEPGEFTISIGSSSQDIRLKTIVTIID